MAFPTTFVSLQSRVIQKAKVDATADLTLVKDCINMAYAELVIETEWLAASGNVTVVAGTDSYDLTAVASGGIGRIKAIQVTQSGETSSPLDFVSLPRIIDLRRGSNTAGPPYCYTLLGYKTLEVFPNPDSSVSQIKIYYVALPTALSGDSDVSILGEPYGSSAIEYGALWRVAEAKWDPSVMSWREEAERWKAKLLQHLDMRRGSHPHEMEFSSFWPSSRPDHDRATIPSWNG